MRKYFLKVYVTGARTLVSTEKIAIGPDCQYQGDGETLSADRLIN